MEELSANYVPAVGTLCLVTGQTSEALKAEQEGDELLASVRRWVQEGTRPSWEQVAASGAEAKALWAMFDCLKLVEGVLCRSWESPDGRVIREQMVIPCSL